MMLWIVFWLNARLWRIQETCLYIQERYLAHHYENPTDVAVPAMTLEGKRTSGH